VEVMLLDGGRRTDAGIQPILEKSSGVTAGKAVKFSTMVIRCPGMWAPVDEEAM
jgi:hypothetical protein